MNLLPNWKTLLLKAWSVRLALLASFLSGLEMIIPMLTPFQPSGWLIFASFCISAGAAIARIVAQPKSIPNVEGPCPPT